MLLSSFTRLICLCWGLKAFLLSDSLCSYSYANCNYSLTWSSSVDFKQPTNPPIRTESDSLFTWDQTWPWKWKLPKGDTKWPRAPFTILMLSTDRAVHSCRVNAIMVSAMPGDGPISCSICLHWVQSFMRMRFSWYQGRLRYGPARPLEVLAVQWTLFVQMKTWIVKKVGIYHAECGINSSGSALHSSVL